MSWHRRAACRGMDVNIFFPIRGQNADLAKLTCASCSVRLECLQESMTTPVERIGVWGGLSERERRALRAAIKGS